MTKFDTKHTTMCVMPWVHEHLDFQKYQRPCCMAEPIKSPRTLEQIRKEMLDNKKPRECHRCYSQEQIGESSNRLIETTAWLSKFGEPDTVPDVMYLDIRNDPTCNLKCKTCGPELSTLWAKEKGLKVSKPDYDLSKYNKSKLKKLYLAGGEPLYNDSYLEFLKELQIHNLDCEVIINSNLKSLPQKWREILINFPNLTFQISCDAIEDLGSYVRYPLIWKQFEKNVEYISKHCPFVTFNLVPSNLTTHKIHETVAWMDAFSKNISLTIVKGDIWEHRAVPMSHRAEYIDSLEKISNYKVSVYYAHKFRKNAKSLLEKYMSKNYDKSLHLRLRQEIAEQDSHRSLKLKNVDPFLHSWIFG